MGTAITVIGLLTGILGTAAAWAAVRMAREPRLDAIRRANADQFVAIRHYQREHVREVIDAALREHQDARADLSLPVLTRPGWILPEPVPLARAILHHVPDSPDFAIDAAVQELRKYWPRKTNGERMESYHEAIDAYDRPAAWFNGGSYRLIQVQPTGGTLEMKFTDARYWEMIDTTESLFFEASLIHARSHGKTIIGRYRRFLNDPFDFARRCAIPGIDSLSIRLGTSSASFYVHRRIPGQVASAQHVIGIVPAGEFQPSDDSWAAKSSDFDLWKSVVREYVEEFLGHEDARGSYGAPINYMDDAPYSGLFRAQLSGEIRSYLLGIALDPVTWKPTILVRSIFPAKLFDRLFSGMVRDNQEGILELPSRRRMAEGPFEGWPFDHESVIAYASDIGVLPAARAGLALAWHHREALGLKT